MSYQSSFTLGVNMVLRDMFSAPAGRVRGSLAGLTNESMRMRQEMLRTSRDLSLGIAAVGYMATRGMGEWIKTGAEFGYTMEFVNVITKATTAEFAALDEKANSLAGKSIFKPTEIASGMQFMAMAGQSAEQIEKNIEAAVYLAQATTHQLGGKGGSADIVTNIMKGFQIEATNSMQVADILTTAVTSANTNLFDMGEAMKYAMSTAHQLGISVEETSAGIMTLGNAGIQASMAGVAMENMLRYYVRAGSEWSTGKVSKVMASIGATKEDIIDTEGRMRSIGDFMGRLKDKMAGTSPAEQYNVMRELFGVRGNRAAIQLFQNLDQFKLFTEKLKSEASGSAQAYSAQLMEELQGRLNALASAWESFKNTFTESIAPALNPLVRGMTVIVKGIQKIASTPILGPAVVTGVAAFVTLTTVFHGLNALINTAVLLSLRFQKAMIGAGVAGTTAMNSVAGATTRANMAMATGMPGVALNSAGRYIYAAGSPFGKGGRYVSKKHMKGFGLKNPGAAGMAARGGMLARIATRLPFLGRALGGLTRLFGLALGPWGLLASFLLPALIGGISSWVSSNKEKTEAEEKASNANIKSGMVRAAGVIVYDNEANTIRRTGLTQQEDNPYMKWGDAGDKASRGVRDIIINFDGEEILRKRMQNIDDENSYEQGLTVTGT